MFTQNIQPVTFLLIVDFFFFFLQRKMIRPFLSFITYKCRLKSERFLALHNCVALCSRLYSTTTACFYYLTLMYDPLKKVLSARI